MKKPTRFSNTQILLTLCGALAIVGTSCGHAQQTPTQQTPTPNNALQGGTMTIIDAQHVPAIVIAPNATASEKFAAQELATYLGKISGQTLKVETTAATPTAKPAIFVGHHPANVDLQPEKMEVEESTIDVTPERIRIVGGMETPLDLGKDKDGNDQTFVRDRGTLYGVYNFLDELGVRWYRPEAWGEYVPQEKTVRVALGRRSSKPVYRYRYGIGGYRWGRDQTPEQAQIGKLWATRNRQNTNRNTPPEQGGYLRVDFSHSYLHILPHATYFKTHPEYFALIDGKRSDNPQAQLCLGNKELQDLIANKIIAAAKAHPEQELFSLEPNDGNRWCQCDLCKAMDDPNLKTAAGGGVSMANRVCAFNNLIARRVAEAVPGAKVGWLAYSTHTEIPTIVKTLEPNTMVQATAFAGSYSDYSKDLRDPRSAQNARFIKILEGYGKLTPIMAHEYWSGYMWHGPLPVIHTMVDRLRQYHRDFNVIGVYCEMHQSWGPQGIGNYFYTRLLWNPDMDVEKELALYYKNYYGPAEKPMKAYHELLESKAASGPYYGSGGSSLDKLFSNTALVTELGHDMDEARALVKGKQPYEQRLEGVWAGYEYVRRINQFLTLQNQGRLSEAIKTLDDLESFILSYKAGDVFDNGPGIYPSTSGMIRKLGKAAKEQLAQLEKFTNPRIVQTYSKGWRFQTDDADGGQAAGWFKTDFDDKAWAPIEATRPWQEQGFPNYKGVAWYRRAFKAPDRSGAQRVVLYFGAVDGDATVYVNGKEIGRHNLAPDGNGWDKPFFFDITDNVNSDRPNQIAVRVKKAIAVGGISQNVQLILADGVH